MLRSKGKNNQGMSLVEVIIAITILGLVAVPVLHSLTTAMVYNAKAGNRQEMTLTAESIMETFKGYSLEELISRFGGDISIGGGTGAGSGIEGVDYQAIDADSGYRCASADIVVGTETARAYTFQINDMKADNGQLYDVTITATPNSVESIVEMEDMETTRDAIFRADRAFDTQALSKAIADFSSDANKTGLKNYFSSLSEDAVVKVGGNSFVIKDGNNIDYLYNSVYSVSYVGNYIKLHERKLTFDISHDTTTDEYIVTPKMVYSYCLVDYPYYVKEEPASVDDKYITEGGSDSPSGNEETLPGRSEKLDCYPTDGTYLEFEVDLSSVCTDGNIYKNPTAAGLNRLFIYYYPQYDLTAGNDKIIIKNNANIPDFQCYILKQRAADINDNQTKIKENSYKANVQINNSAPRFEVFHNFDDNIGEGSSTTAPTISGTISGVYSYTKEVSLASRFEEKEVLSYKLELKVEQEGRTITTLESSMNEKIK